jgi:hypothetical protein
VKVPPPRPEYLEFLKPFDPEIVARALAVREMVMAAAPGCSELIYDAYNAVTSGYSFTGRPSDAFIHIPVYAKWVNLGFNRGSQLKDPEKLLVGTGRWVRHVRITDVKDLKRPAIRALVKAAIEEAPVPAVPQRGESVVRAIYPKKRRPVNFT